MQLKHGTLILTATMGLAPCAMAANEELEPIELQPITVEAEKFPVDRDRIAASVTVIDADRIEREMARSIEELVRYEPGIDVPYQGSRFGSSGFVIRGIGGNRVRVEVDGVPVSDAFSIGDFSNASRNFVDVDSLKQVEIMRGPASAVFGSNAIGGVVSFITKDPSDYVIGDGVHGSGKAGYYSSDDGWVAGGTLAGQSGNWGGLGQVTYRAGNERQDISADPHDYDSLNLLAKLVHGDPDAGGLRLTLERFEENSDTDVDSLERIQDFSEAFGFPYIIDTNRVTADDSRERTRFSLGQESSSGWLGTAFLRWRAYYQESETEQRTYEERATIIFGQANPVARERLFRFEQELYGAELNLVSEFETGGVSHELAYGAEVEVADTSQIRDGLQTSLITGDFTNVVGPDAYPVRDFPNSETTSIGVYVQDRITLGAFTLIPGLRWDDYELDPKPDAIFEEDNPGVSPVGLDESNLSPKLGALWQLSEHWQIYAQYAEGFRAPPVNDVNVGFTNFEFGYTAIPNPDLKSETSKGYEAGIRYGGDAARFDLSGYKTDYDEFIQSFQAVGFDPFNNLIIFQSVNLDEVEIHGVEGRLDWAPEAFPDGWLMHLSAAWSEGDNEVTGQPLNTVQPFTATLGLDFTSQDARWGGSLVARGASKQDRLDESEGELYVPGGYVVFDATAWFRPTPNTRIRGGLFNLFDQDYTRWLDVAGLPADLANPQRYQGPGFNVGLMLDIKL